MSLGAKYDELHGEPLELTVYVKALHDGRRVTGLDYLPRNEFVIDRVGVSEERHFSDLGIEYYKFIA